MTNKQQQNPTRYRRALEAWRKRPANPFNRHTQPKPEQFELTEETVAAAEYRMEDR